MDNPEEMMSMPGKHWDEALEICADWLAESADAETRTVRFTLLESIVQTLDGAAVLAECLAEKHALPDVFRDNNDNYMRLMDALRIFKKALGTFQNN